MTISVEIYPEGILNAETLEMTSWQDVIEEYVESITTHEGDFVVEGADDSVSETLDLITAMRDAADELEEKLKSSNVLVDEFDVMTVSQYLRGEY